jgi:hypothetical protein
VTQLGYYAVVLRPGAGVTGDSNGAPGNREMGKTGRRARFLRHESLVGFHPITPVTLATATAIVVACVAAASYLPTRRVLHVDPAFI